MLLTDFYPAFQRGAQHLPFYPLLSAYHFNVFAIRNNKLKTLSIHAYLPYLSAVKSASGEQHAVGLDLFGLEASLVADSNLGTNAASQYLYRAWCQQRVQPVEECNFFNTQNWRSSTSHQRLHQKHFSSKEDACSCLACVVRNSSPMCCAQFYLASGYFHRNFRHPNFNVLVKKLAWFMEWKKCELNWHIIHSLQNANSLF